MKIRDLDLSKRTIHALQANNITTVEELASYTLKDVLSLPQIGPGAIEEIKAALSSDGLSFREDAVSQLSLSTSIDNLTTRTDELFLSRKSVNALQRARVLTVKDLLEEKRDLLSINLVGEVKAAEIEYVRERLRERFSNPQ